MCLKNKDCKGEILLDINFSLTENEIYESLLSLAWKKEGVYKQIHITILSIFSSLYLCLYIFQPERFYYIMISVLCISFMFAILYFIPFLRKKKAKKMAIQNGTYNIKIYSNGTISDGQNNVLNFQSKKTLVFDSKNVITINFDNSTTYCIPKSKLKTIHINNIKNILRKNKITLIEIKV